MNEKLTIFAIGCKIAGSVLSANWQNDCQLYCVHRHTIVYKERYQVSYIYRAQFQPEPLIIKRTLRHEYLSHEN